MKQKERRLERGLPRPQTQVLGGGGTALLFLPIISIRPRSTMTTMISARFTMPHMLPLFEVVFTLSSWSFISFSCVWIWSSVEL